MKNVKLNLAVSIFALVLSLIITTGTVFAWFSLRRSFTEAEFKPGGFNKSLQLQYWEKRSGNENKWTSVVIEGINGVFFPYFGNLTDISELPQDCAVYLKMKVIDNSGAKYKYDISAESIVVNIYNYSNGAYQSITDNASINNINYYSASLPQSCIESYYVKSNNGNLAFNEVSFPLEAARINTENFSFSAGEFAAYSEWMYVKLALRQVELLNIIRQIPAAFMPYAIEFMFSIKSEIRTMDYEL